MLSEKPWNFIDFLLVMALMTTLLLVGVASNLLAAAGAGAPTGARGQEVSFIVALCFYAGMLALVHMMVRWRETSWEAAFGFRSERRTSAMLMALGVILIAFPITIFLGDLSREIMTRFHLTPVAQSSVQVLQETVSIEPQIYLGVMAILAAPVTEELLFRGILYPFVKQQGYPRAALWGTAILFGMLHLNLMTFLPLTFLGLVLAWLYETTDNLIAPIFAHSLFNLANFMWAVAAKSGG